MRTCLLKEIEREREKEEEKEKEGTLKVKVKVKGKVKEKEKEKEKGKVKEKEKEKGKGKEKEKGKGKGKAKRKAELEPELDPEPESEPEANEKQHFCYILQQVGKPHLCNYVGYTVNFGRRIRQHNQLIRGGARFTKNRGPWEFLVVMTCDIGHRRHGHGRTGTDTDT